MFRDLPPADLHVHLNGTTEADFVWQTALQRPYQTYRTFRGVRGRPAVRDQFIAQHEACTEEDLLELFHRARRLRVDCVPFNNIGDCGDWACAFHGDDHPCQRGELELHECELLFWIQCFQNLELKQAHHLHRYLLMHSFFYQFVVQQEDQKGFDQFQKITLNEMRTLHEQRYRARFQQLGASARISYLEGRFAPKSSLTDMKRLLLTIIRDYEGSPEIEHSRLCEPVKPSQPSSMQLRLVAHFIKEADPKADGRAADFSPLCRHQYLRQKLAVQAHHLHFLHQTHDKIRQYVTGVDAAANELHAPPEVFAPIYHYLRIAGWVDFTYHVGEDYRHLVSGIRAIYEAVWYLGLRDGNRIGHGTALGIDAQVWLDQCPERVLLPRGEWLDNLVFMYALCAEQDSDLLRLRDQIEHNWYEIYGSNPEGDPMPGLGILVEAWRYRGYDPLIYLEDQALTLDPLARIQQERHRKVLEQHPLPFRELKRYHNACYWQKWSEPIEVDPRLFKVKDLRLLQHRTIDFLNHRVVAIESMPTSNVRIAPYSDYKDHHLFRWLGIGAAADGPKPTVVLASDDPGIFANHLQAEYAHVLETMVQHFKLSHDEAMAHLWRLNQNGRNFLFGSGQSLGQSTRR